ncbi:MAG: DNA (cytosine-5-)-methyltransferase [Sideroxydans sp.]|jgi:DNA (cytosine-5)-methyltransferase 1
MKYTVCELFAGVGGFRLGLERGGWKTVFANQWEPATKTQHAADCYLSHFPDEASNPHFNTDINLVTAQLDVNSKTIPDHTLLVGGFPCQDYSVATTKAKGMLGKKGVLWWEIEKIIRHKSPQFVLLENVDRLLVSPAKQRGRDMGILLACFRDLGYSVEWRVINAADYGFPQKRRRVFIFASRKDTKVVKKIKKVGLTHEWLQTYGFFASEFPVEQEPTDHDTADVFDDTLQEISDNFSFKLHNAGVMSDGKLYTLKVVPKHSTITPLKSVLLPTVDKKYYVADSDIDKTRGWRYVKGAKREERTSKTTGYKYFFTEGAIPFPENLNSPSRTILTGEGNQSPNRSTHLIQDPRTKKFRTLTPIEVERLNGFPDDWTNSGMPHGKRYFCMGNALVVGLVERMGKHLKEFIK